MADAKIVGGKSIVGRGAKGVADDCPVCLVGEGAVGAPFWPHYAAKTSPSVTTIFARSNGSDECGDGTAKSPFQTLQHAVRVVPPLIPQGVIYRIDITGIQEQLPTDYPLPEWKTWEIDDEPVGTNLTNFQPGVEIFATPRPVSAIPLAETIINAADVLSVTTDPLTGLQTVNLVAARSSWTPANILGKQVLDATGGTNNAVVGRVNSTSSILLTNSAAPTFPLALVEPSAWLHGSGSNFGTIRANNIDNIGFTGIKITSDNGFLGLVAAGSGSCICQLCELDSPALLQQSGSLFDFQANRMLRSWVYNFPSFSGVVGIVQSLITNATPVSVNDTPFFCAPTTVTIRRSVFSACDPIEVTAYEPGGNIDGAGTGHILVQHTLVENGNADGLVFHGTKGHVTNADFAGNAGNGITVADGGGQLSLENAGSSVANGGFGVEIDDGMQVIADAATTGNATPLAGAGGQISLGSVGVVGWATVAALPNNVADFTGVSATGSRISQQ